MRIVQEIYPSPLVLTLEARPNVSTSGLASNFDIKIVLMSKNEGGAWEEIHIEGQDDAVEHAFLEGVERIREARRTLQAEKKLALSSARNGRKTKKKSSRLARSR